MLVRLGSLNQSLSLADALHLHVTNNITYHRTTPSQQKQKK